MKEHLQTVIGVGTALVDIKVIDPTEGLPKYQSEVEAFLSRNRDINKTVGGSMANVMSLLAKLMPSKSVNFLQRVGLDSNGDFYRKQTPVELINGIQVDI